jgi:hypothetical protein
MVRYLLLTFLLTRIVLVDCALSQDFTPSTKWTGELRMRNEIDRRDFNSSTPSNTYSLLRTRLGLEALPAENVRVFIQAQDSRAFGQEKDASGFSTSADTKNIDLHQGYIEVKNMFSDRLTLRLGRQELSYGNERLIGSLGWSNTGRSFDGGLAKLNFTDLSLDVFAMNVGEVQSPVSAATPATVSYVRDAGQDFYGFYSTIKSITNHKIDAYVLYQWNRALSAGNSDSLQRFTVGSYIKGTADAFDYEAELAFQGGTIATSDISAFMGTTALGYSFREMILSRITIGYEYLSGTESPGPDFSSFDPMYHTGHKFYGFMDYFITIPTHTGNRGLTDVLLRTSFKFTDAFSGNAWIHHFATAKTVNGESILGQEIDLVASYRYNTALAFELGLAAFVPGPLMRQRFNGSDVGLWGYLTTTAAF